MTRKFQHTLLAVIIGLIVMALGGSGIAVYQAININIKNNALRELSVGQNVFNRLLESNQANLTQRASILADDFGFKRAVATNENDTIISALSNHGERVNADLLLLLDTRGDIIASTHNITTIQPTLVKQIQNPQAISSFAIIEQQLYQFVLVPVRAPQLIAWTGLGFVVDTNLANTFKRITNEDITFLLSDNNNRFIGAVSTLPESLLPANVTQYSEQIDTLLDNLKQQNWISQSSHLAHLGKGRVDVLLSASLTQAQSDFRTLYMQVVIIIAVILALSALLALWFGRTVTRPIEALVLSAKAYANGHYEEQPKVTSRNEFGVLANTLVNMSAAIQEREASILYQALHDPHTDLPNKRSLDQDITERLKNGKADLTLALIRVVNFDELTDRYGTLWSRGFFKKVIARLQQSNPQCYWYRSSTTQLVTLVPHLNEKNLKQWAGQVIEKNHIKIEHEGFSVPVILHCGIVINQANSTSYDQLLRRSHIALHNASTAPSKFSIYQAGQDENHLRQIQITHNLQLAIAQQSLSLHVQPKFHLEKDTTIEVEALLRWNDAELGQVFPDEFIPAAESSGFINELTYWVLEQALIQLQVWEKEGIDIAIGINISAHDLLHAGFVDHVTSQLQHFGIAPEKLILEVTESAMVENPEDAITYLNALHDAGIGLSIDDFGTGYSSLSQLKQMPVDELKIDKSFVMQLASSDDDQKIVKSTVQLAHSLHHTVIAEGVEDEESLCLLRAMGCDCVQGYFISRPMPIDTFAQWYRQQPSYREAFEESV